MQPYEGGSPPVISHMTQIRTFGLAQGACVHGFAPKWLQTKSGFLEFLNFENFCCKCRRPEGQALFGWPNPINILKHIPWRLRFKIYKSQLAQIQANPPLKLAQNPKNDNFPFKTATLGCLGQLEG
jgi:hypothetical protein